jgi:hypothetical protein
MIANCGAQAGAGQLDCQTFPKTGPISRRLDWSKQELNGAVARDCGTVYAYVMTSVKLVGGKFCQTGTGPNLEGGVITLCTCKHHTRARLACEEWANNWFAGFTNKKCGGRQWLFYLARVKTAFESQVELWHSGALSEETRRLKSASRSKFGDIYEPKRDIRQEARHDPKRYEEPIIGHDHRKYAGDNEWRLDIDYWRKPLKRRTRRRPSLLVCDPDASFLWTEPAFYKSAKWREKEFHTIQELLDGLKGP